MHNEYYIVLNIQKNFFKQSRLALETADGFDKKQYCKTILTIADIVSSHNGTVVFTKDVPANRLLWDIDAYAKRSICCQVLCESIKRKIGGFSIDLASVIRDSSSPIFIVSGVRLEFSILSYLYDMLTTYHARCVIVLIDTIISVNYCVDVRRYIEGNIPVDGILFMTSQEFINCYTLHI